MAEAAHRLVTGPFPGLEQWLTTEVAARLRSPNSPRAVTVLVNGALVRQRLQRRFDQQGVDVRHVNFHTFRSFPDHVMPHGGDLAVQLPAGGADALLRSIFNGRLARNYFAPALEKPGLRAALLHSLDELAFAFSAEPPAVVEALAEAAATLSDSAGKLGDLGRLFTAYRMRLAERHTDGAGRLAAAIAALDDGSDAVPDDIYIYGLVELSELERRLWAACARRSTLTILLPHDGSEACRWLNDVREFCLQKLGCSSILAPDGESPAGLSHVRDTWFAPELSSGDGGQQGHAAAEVEEGEPVAVAIRAAPGETREVREAIRELLTAAGAGIPPAEMAILFRDAGRYRMLVHQTLRGAGIPHFLADGLSLAQTRTGRAALLLLRLVDPGRRRLDVMELFLTAPLRWESLVPDAGDGSNACRPSAWDRLTRQAMITGGAQPWQRRLAALRSLIEDALAGDVEETDTSRLQADRDDLEALSSAVESLFVRLDMLDAQRSWQDGITGLVTQLDELFTPGDELEQIKRAIADLEPLAELELDTNPASFRTAAANAIAAASIPIGQFDKDLFVGDLAGTYGLGFRLICLLGAGEHIFPAPPYRDPILDDRERRSLNDSGSGRIAVADDRAGGEEFLFQTLLHAAREQVLIFYPFMGSEGGELYPSYFVLHVAEALTGVPFDAQVLAGVPGYRRIPASRLAPLSPDEALTPLEYDLAEVYGALERVSLTDRGQITVSNRLGYLDRLSPSFAFARELVRSRIESVLLDPFDGVFQEEGTRQRLARRYGLDGQPMAPTSVELYATCPRRYFLSRILQLRPVEEPVEIRQIDPGLRGRLVHEILQRFYAGLASEAALPLQPEGIDAYRARLHVVAQEAFASLQSHGLSGASLLWDLEQCAILEDLDEWLDREIEDAGREGFVPFLFEASFGMKPPPGGHELPAAVVALAGGRSLRFRGIVDRVDRSEDGARYRVVDYKTGRAPDRVKIDNLMMAGHALQLPVYLLASAAVEGLSQSATGTAEYYYLTQRGRFRHIRFDQPELEQRRSDLATILGTIADGVSQGQFFPYPGERRQNCAYCEFASVCDSRVDALFERKRDDPAAAAFLALSEIR